MKKIKPALEEKKFRLPRKLKKYWKKEIERCKSAKYFYENYCLVNDTKPSLTERELEWFKVFDEAGSEYKGLLFIKKRTRL